MKILLMALALTMIALQAQADTATVTYTAPTERVDNSPLAESEIGGFRVYDDQGVIELTLPAGARSFDLQATGQTLYITTYDTDGRESVYSQAIVLPVGKASPKPPANISVGVSIGGGG